MTAQQRPPAPDGVSFTRNVIGAARLAFGRCDPDGRPRGAYSLGVLAPSVIDAVRLAGGVLADQALAAWDVAVYAPPCDENRALRILGAQLHELAELSDTNWMPPTALIISMPSCTDDDAVMDCIESAAFRQRGTIVYWAIGSTGHDDDQSVISHELSSAAKALKSYALEAAGVTHLIPSARECFFLAPPRGERSARCQEVGSPMRPVAE